MIKKKFSNVENTPYNIDGKVIWHSRSVAINVTTLVIKRGGVLTYALVSKRGPKAADFQGLMNNVAGYLDWNESGTQAVFRETWEETGLDLEYLLNHSEILGYNLDQPWHVKTTPDENQQNISLRYGILLTVDELPELCLDYNEIPGEVEDPMWLPVKEIDNYKWAFNHDIVIKEYMKKFRIIQ